MAYGHNPFSEKTQWGGLIQDILFPLAQSLLINKMFKGQGQQAGQPRLGTTPTAQPRPTTSMGQSQQAMRQRMPQTIQQTQGMGMPTGDVTGGNVMEAILQALPPHLRQAYLEQVRLGSWKQQTPAGRMG